MDDENVLLKNFLGSQILISTLGVVFHILQMIAFIKDTRGNIPCGQSGNFGFALLLFRSVLPRYTGPKSFVFSGAG